jgi:hypothetical protein
MLFKSEAMAIGGYSAALPNLREVDWTLWMGHVEDHPIDAIEALTLMLGHGDSIMTQGHTVQRKKQLKQLRATLNAHDITNWKQHVKDQVRFDSRLSLEECTTRSSAASMRAIRQWWETKAGIWSPS